MQIHELNSFTGNLDSGAFLAVDNGNDTGKVSAEKLLAETNARVDNLISTARPGEVTTLWTGNISSKNETASLSESILDFDYIDVYVSSSDTLFIRKAVIDSGGSPLVFQIQTQNLPDDGSSQFIQWYETALSISQTTATITNAVRCLWSDFNSMPVVSAGSGANIVRIDGVKLLSADIPELADIRVGADGITYPSAGDAVRAQFNDLNSKIENGLTVLGSGDNIIINVTDHYPKATFPLFKGQTIKYTNNTNQTCYVTTYRADGTYKDWNANLGAGNSYTFVVDDDDYVQIGGYTNAVSGTTAVEATGVYDAISQLSENTESEISDIKGLIESTDYKTINELTWTNGYFVRASDGVIRESVNFKYSELVPVRTGDSIPYSLHGIDNVVAVIAAYDNTETYKVSKSVYKDGSTSGSANLYEGTYVVPDDIAYIRVCIWSTSVSSADTISIPNHYSQIQKNKEDIEDINTRLDNLGNLNHWEGKKWVAFGTSLTDNYSQNAVITQGDHAGEPTGKYVPYLLDMSELSASSFVNRGIAGGCINGHILYYIRYYSSDEANADLITIEGAVNDFASDIPLGEVGDTVPYTHTLLQDGSPDGSFAGACYQAFTTALTNAPNAVVVLLTETTGKNHTGYANYDQLRKNNLGLYQSDYIEMTMKVAEFVGIPVINCGRDSMINAQNPQYIADHIHHTYLGGYQYARVIWEKLRFIMTKAISLPT